MTRLHAKLLTLYIVCMPCSDLSLQFFFSPYPFSHGFHHLCPGCRPGSWHTEPVRAFVHTFMHSYDRSPCCKCGGPGLPVRSIRVHSSTPFSKTLNFRGTNSNLLTSYAQYMCCNVHATNKGCFYFGALEEALYLKTQPEHAPPLCQTACQIFYIYMLFSPLHVNNLYVEWCGISGLMLYNGNLWKISTALVRYIILILHMCVSILRFSPEILGMQASSALVWLIIEVLAVLLSLYLVTVNTDLTTIDLVAFSGYKYVG